MTASEDNSLSALLLLHNRSQFLESQLETLASARVNSVYVSIDGPRNGLERDKQKKIRMILKSFKHRFKAMHIRESQVNLGLGLGIVTGLDWFFENNDQGMIFEDDIVFENDCIKFFNLGISWLFSNKKFLLIGGSNPFAELSQSNDAVLTNYPQIWGWATLKERWVTMRNHILKQPEPQVKLPTSVREFWRTGWRRVNEGYVDTWDTPIAAGMRLSGEICILPPVNLTSNRGVDAFAVNTKKIQFPLGIPIAKLSAGVASNIDDCRDSIDFINKKFEREIYKVSYRHSFSNFARILDRVRFQKPKKPLPIKLKSMR